MVVGEYIEYAIVLYINYMNKKVCWEKRAHTMYNY